MNTPTLLFMIIGVLLYLCAIYAGVKNIVREKDSSLRKVHYVVLAIVILFGVFLAVISLNAYGYLRLPLVNEVTRRLPEDYTPNTGLAKPPSAGSTQPPSQPVIDTHKEQMDKLKRDGF